MKFRLETVYLNASDKILEKYPALKEFNIETIENRLYITLNSLEDMMKLSEKFGEIIIASYEKERTIEIYDDYRE